MRAATQHFVCAGRELIAAKKQCRHGEWAAFLKAAGVKSLQTAQRLMRAAAAVDSGAVPEGLSMTATLKTISRATEKRHTVTHLPEPAAAGKKPEPENPGPKGAPTRAEKLELEVEQLASQLAVQDATISELRTQIAQLEAHFGHRSEAVLEARRTAQIIRTLRASINTLTEDLSYWKRLAKSLR